MNPTPLRSNGVRGVESPPNQDQISGQHTVSPSVRDQLPNTPSVVPQQIPWYQTRRPATESVTKVGLKTGVALAAMEDVVPASDYELAPLLDRHGAGAGTSNPGAATEKAKTAPAPPLPLASLSGPSPPGWVWLAPVPFAAGWAKTRGQQLRAGPPVSTRNSFA